MQGRKPGRRGHELAQSYIRQSFQQAGLEPLQADYSHEFAFRGGTAKNLIAKIPGKTDRTFVVTAHYDHLGKKGHRIFNGADDNASGVAAMLEIARQLQPKQLQHTVLFVATDAEESGLYGAKAFLREPPVALQQIQLNINLDMIAYGGRKKRLYLAGGKAFPKLKPVIDQAIEQANLCLKAGHDNKSFNFNRQYRIDWLRASDHYPFYKQGIPYLFFSGPDHRYYHTQRDTADKIDSNFYTAVVETVLLTIKLADAQLSQKR